MGCWVRVEAGVVVVVGCNFIGLCDALFSFYQTSFTVSEIKGQGGGGGWSGVEGVGCNIIGLCVKIFSFSQINCVCLDDAGARYADYISHSLTAKISGFFSRM